MTSHNMRGDGVMNVKRLQTFILVVEKRSFSEVADILEMTQSGVSRQIKTLEDEVGIQLLNRNTAHVELTTAGDYVYKRAKQLVEQWENLVHECQLMKGERSGKLRIGASTIPATYLIPDILKACQQKYPRMELCMSTKDSSEILTSLENQKIDVALVGRKPDVGRFHSHQIAEDRLLLIGHASVPKIASLQDIRSYPIILREKGSGTREAMERALRDQGVELEQLNCAIEVSSTDSVMAMVESGVGLSFVSHLAMNKGREDHVRILYELPTDRGFYLAYLKSRASHPLVQAFVQETLTIYETAI